MDEKSSSLGTQSLCLLQIIKSALRSKKTTATAYFGREDVLYTPLHPGLVPWMVTAWMVGNGVKT